MLKNAWNVACVCECVCVCFMLIRQCEDQHEFLTNRMRGNDFSRSSQLYHSIPGWRLLLLYCCRYIVLKVSLSTYKRRDCWFLWPGTLEVIQSWGCWESGQWRHIKCSPTTEKAEFLTQSDTRGRSNHQIYRSQRDVVIADIIAVFELSTSDSQLICDCTFSHTRTADLI